MSNDLPGSSLCEHSTLGCDVKWCRRCPQGFPLEPRTNKLANQGTVFTTGPQNTRWKKEEKSPLLEVVTSDLHELQMCLCELTCAHTQTVPCKAECTYTQGYSACTHTHRAIVHAHTYTQGYSACTHTHIYTEL